MESSKLPSVPLASFGHAVVAEVLPVFVSVELVLRLPDFVAVAATVLPAFEALKPKWDLLSEGDAEPQWLVVASATAVGNLVSYSIIYWVTSKLNLRWVILWSKKVAGV